ncbi:MAG: ribosome maturation factor RimM [Campylobacterota bacterium]|nr:ribosome maturation factor RimM [Campylobacterota bacterium]
MDKIYVAKIGKAVGLKGQQKLHIDSDFPEQFKKGTILTTHKNKQLIIESFNAKNNTVKFEGIDDCDMAKKITNAELFITEEQSRESCNLGKNQYFWFDIIGCEVIENGEVLGSVTDVQRMPLSDYLEIETSKELVDKEFSKSFLVPYLDEYILSVDIENKKINIINGKEILEAS